jgi:hypothetical protein
MNQMYVQNEKKEATNLLYDNSWVMYSIQFELNAPDKTDILGGTSGNLERSKLKTKITNSPRSVNDKVLKSFTQKNFLSFCIDSSIRPSKTKAEAETFHHRPKYEEMESNNEVTF